MTGPEHYREAERLLDQAASLRVSLDHPNPAYRSPNKVAAMAANMTAQAQAHATLAHTAATADPHVADYFGDPGAVGREWAKAVVPK